MVLRENDTIATMHDILYGKSDGFQPEDKYAPVIPQEAESNVFSYFQNNASKSLPLLRIAIGCSSAGNFFVTEIAKMLANELRGMGMQPMLFDEFSVHGAVDHNLVFVLAPHEFFTLGGETAWQVLSECKNLVFINTEQAETQRFAIAKNFLSTSNIIFDINFGTAAALRAAGYRSYFLPLGYSRPFEQAHSGQVLDRYGPLACLPESVLQSAPQSYSARPIDVLFVGTLSPKRNHFFAQHAAFFSNLETFFYFPEDNSFFYSQDSSAIDFSRFAGLVRRSKILLNVHKDEAPYLEWQRVVSLGIMQRTLVVSEQCEFGAVIAPNVHYIDAPIDALPGICEYYVKHADLAEKFSAFAYDDLRVQCPLDRVLHSMLVELNELNIVSA